jgi:hypothetical protein
VAAERFGTSEIKQMISEVGVAVEFTDAQGQTFCGSGIVDETDQDMLSAGDVTIAGHVIAVTVETEAFPGLAAAATLTVDEVEYRVVQVRQLDDGALTRTWCARKT